MKNLKQAGVGLAMGLGLALASPAAAEPIMLDGSNVGESYTISFDGFVDQGPSLEGLSSSLDLTLTSILNGVYNFDYALTNTGSTTDSVSSRVSSFAFNTDPTITGAQSTGTFGFTTLDSNYPNGIGTVDVCFKGASTGSCAGGGSGGVFDGETGSGSLALDFGGAIAALTLDDFFVRYQSIDGLGHIGSASGRQTSSTTSTTSSTSGGTDVPAPGMVGLLGLALMAVFGIRRRKVSTANPGAAPAYA